MTTAKQTIEALQKWLNDGKHRQIAIRWYWSRRDRAGAITAYENGKEVAQVCYARNTQCWVNADSDITSLRTGSAKHKALAQIVTLLNT